MALISDPGNQRSTFPTTLDTFTNPVDGVALPSVVDAELYNKAKTAILRAQEHTQKCARFVDGGIRRKLSLRSVVTVTGSVSIASTVLTLTSAQMLYLRNQPFRLGNQIFASVSRHDASGNEYYTNIEPIEPNQIRVWWDRMDQDLDVTAGQYVTQVTIIGV
jgi:hypothetical protein